MIVQALYGGKFAGRNFWNQLRRCIKHLRFESLLDDPNVWMHDSTRAYEQKYYKYVLLYVDDCLVISEKAEDILPKGIEK